MVVSAEDQTTAQGESMNAETIQSKAAAAGYHFQRAGYLARRKENWVLIQQVDRDDITAFATLAEVDAWLRQEAPDGEAPRIPKPPAIN
mgnify:CR=1 FL=1